MLDSVMEFSKDSFSVLLKEYVDNAIEHLKYENEKFGKEAIKACTRRRFFGIRGPLAENPSADQAVEIVKKKLNWYGYSKQSYRARRIQAKMFQDMMDRSDPDAKMLISVDDHAMLMNGDYSSKASWNGDKWDSKNDPVIAACY